MGVAIQWGSTTERATQIGIETNGDDKSYTFSSFARIWFDILRMNEIGERGREWSEIDRWWISNFVVQVETREWTHAGCSYEFDPMLCVLNEMTLLTLWAS